MHFVFFVLLAHLLEARAGMTRAVAIERCGPFPRYLETGFAATGEPTDSELISEWTIPTGRPAAVITYSG